MMIAAIFISIICHILCFEGIEPIFSKAMIEGSPEFSKIFFLGQILQHTDYHLQSARGVNGSGPYTPSSQSIRGIGYSPGRLSARIFIDMLKVDPSPIHEAGLNLINSEKPALADLIEQKLIYFNPASISQIRKSDSSIMFHPKMPYHFLLYFKDRQTAHVEVDFYISPEGKVVRIKRKISSGNPEVDLLIMRNFTHFINLCKSNFALGSWRTVKIDLSP